jgi:hypothetical protein
MRTRLSVMAFLIPGVAGGVPLELSHSVRAVDASGNPVNGPVDVTVRVYAASTGGAALFTQPFTGVSAEDGYLNLTVTGLPVTLFDGSTRYLSVDIGGVELTPRAPILSVPYAVRAGAVTLGDEAGACTVARAGTLRFVAGNLELCDGASADWRRVALALTADGSTQARAARDCRTLHAEFPLLTTSTYWIDPDGDSDTADAFVARCDMSTDGGGWTVVTNNHNGDTEPSGCVPRLATTGAQVCGTVGVSTTDWSVLASDLRFQEIAWVAYTGSFVPSAYNLMKWNTLKTFPSTTGGWFFDGDLVDQTLSEWSALPKMHCNSGTATLRSVGSKVPNGGTATAYGGAVVTMWTEQLALAGTQMSFTDYNSHSTGQLAGLDDFQDGFGCGDDWNPVSQKGRATFVMVR